MNKKKGNIMNDDFDKYLLELGEITELQECIIDVLENCMYRNKKPFHSIALINVVKNRTNKLYFDIDNYTMPINQE